MKKCCYCEEEATKIIAEIETDIGGKHIPVPRKVCKDHYED